MPAILTTLEQMDAWLRAQWSEASTLRRPLPDAALRIAAKDEKATCAPLLDSIAIRVGREGPATA